MGGQQHVYYICWKFHPYIVSPNNCYKQSCLQDLSNHQHLFILQTSLQTQTTTTVIVYSKIEHPPSLRQGKTHQQYNGLKGLFSRCRIFSLQWRPICGLQLLCDLSLGCCLWHIYPFHFQFYSKIVMINASNNFRICRILNFRNISYKKWWQQTWYSEL